MTDTKTPDEQPKAQIAKKVISAKRKYFFPARGAEVEASSPEEAEQLMKRQTKNQEGK